MNLDEALARVENWESSPNLRPQPAVAKAVALTLAGELERSNDALRRIREWSKAYPLAVFPEPDMKQAHAALQAAGMTLDAISAANIRYVLNGVIEIIDSTLPPANPEI